MSTRISSKQRSTHVYIIGQPGVGKSRFIESWVMRDVRAGNGLAVIDPHGDLFNNLLLRMSAIPSIAKRLVIIDPCSDWVLSINPLAPIDGVSDERLAQFITDIVIKIWGLNTSNAPRMLWLLTNTLLGLALSGKTLFDLPRFLTDQAFRDNALVGNSNEALLRYFNDEFPTSEKDQQQWTSPVLNKLSPLVFDPDLSLYLAHGRELDFRQLMDERKILLVHLPKGIIGEAPSALLGAFIVARIQKAALSRSDQSRRAPFYLYLDEFQNYTTDNIVDILAESRKYGLSLILANQYLNQLPNPIKHAVLNTTGTLISFRTGYQDAVVLSRELFSGLDGQQKWKPDLSLKLLNGWPRVGMSIRRKPVKNISDPAKVTALQNRQFWLKLRGQSNAEKYRTPDMPDVHPTPALTSSRDRIIAIVGERYGFRKEELRSWIANTATTRSKTEKDASIWSR